MLKFADELWDSMAVDFNAVFTELDLSTVGPGPDSGRNPDGAGS